ATLAVLAAMFVELVLMVIFLTSWDHTIPFLLLLCYNLAILFLVVIGARQMLALRDAGSKLAAGDLSFQLDTEKLYWDFKRHGDNLNAIAEGMNKAVEQRMKSERLKTELITNVSHDIKTPLTSIVNYVDLLQKPHSS